MDKHKWDIGGGTPKNFGTNMGYDGIVLDKFWENNGIIVG